MGKTLDNRRAQSFWLRAPGSVEIRPVGLPDPGPDDVVVRTFPESYDAPWATLEREVRRVREKVGRLYGGKGE